MDPPKEFSRVELSLDNCIIHKDRLLETCSAKDGMSHDLEVDLRIMGCDLIQSAGLLLRLPQVSLVGERNGVNLAPVLGCYGSSSSSVAEVLLFQVVGQIQYAGE